MPKVRKRVPSGRVVFKSRRKRPKKAKCARCGKPLHGIPRLKPSKFKKLTKSKKKTERPYGGNLCSNCMRELFKEKARKI